MSSHSEAPEISKDPVADSTDLYAFVSPDSPDKVTLIANYIPRQQPAGGPNFYEFGDDVLYEIHVDNNGDGDADVTLPVPVRDDAHRHRRERHLLVQHGPDHEPQRHDLEPQAVLLGDQASRAARPRSWRAGCACPPCNVGKNSIPNYAALTSQAIHTIGSTQGLRRAARRRLLRRPGLDLRPRRPAPVPTRLPLEGRGRRRGSTRWPRRTSTASPSRCRSRAHQRRRGADHLHRRATPRSASGRRRAARRPRSTRRRHRPTPVRGSRSRASATR